MRLTHARFTVTAGALIFNDAGKVLLLKHRFRAGSGWGLPGGFLEAGEQPVEALKRELWELDFRHVNTNSDSEVLLNVLALELERAAQHHRLDPEAIFRAVAGAHRRCRGAYACVAMIAMRDIGIPHEKINVNGGATALGHPIGASGARITTTLIAALQDRGLKRGVASLCIGGGEATAIAVELV